MDYEYILHLQQSHTGIQMLRATRFPLMASFLWQCFINNNQRIWRLDDLADRLDDHLHLLRLRMGDDQFPRAGKDYLEDWCDKHGYLRKYYVEGDDIARVELTAPVEKTLAWLSGLQSRHFVGTESRLKTVFDLLRSLTRQTETDTERRIQHLQEQKDLIEQQIQRTRSGDFPVLDDTQVRERFAQLQDTAHALLRDFSEVEQNFRQLDQQSRRRIAQQDGHRGEILGNIFSDVDAIRESDQGRSFNTFWEFLMSLVRQQELDELLEKIQTLPAIAQQATDFDLVDLKPNLMDAADKVMSTNRQLAEQLRRFLDDRARLDNRRISNLIKSIRQQLLWLREKDLDITDGAWMRLAQTRVSVNSPIPSLYRVPLSVSGQDHIEDADDRRADAGRLFAQEYVDEAQLARRIRQCLETKTTVSLAEILRQFPPARGLAELVSYVKLASESDAALVDTEREETFMLNIKGQDKVIALPHILFTR